MLTCFQDAAVKFALDTSIALVRKADDIFSTQIDQDLFRVQQRALDIDQCAWFAANRISNRILQPIKSLSSKFEDWIRGACRYDTFNAQIDLGDLPSEDI